MDAPPVARLPLDAPSDVMALDELLSRPTPGAVEALATVDGDILVLGAAGKMGPTLARMARRATDAVGNRRRIIAVSRFTQPDQRRQFEAHGIETLAGDLLDDSVLTALPDAPNIIYMAGMKFGATGNEALTWQMNTVLPARIAARFPTSRIAAFSTGNVYGLSPIHLGGSIESDPANPQGEYAMSCLGRERVLEHAARARGTPTAILRLNYACELRYGVLVDLAQRLLDGQPIDLSMPMVNVIWQGDANAWALQALALTQTPARILNLAGPEQLSVRRVCEQLAMAMNVTARFAGNPAAEALLSNGQLVHRLCGYPQMPIDRLINWVARWVSGGGTTLGKATKFEVRDGRF